MERIIDGDFTFDNETKQYTPTRNWVTNTIGDPAKFLHIEHGENVNTASEQFCRYATNKLYSWISDNAFRPIQSKYIIAYYPEAHRQFKLAMEFYMIKLIKEGDLGIYSGTNLTSGSKTKISSQDTVGQNVMEALKGAGIVGGSRFYLSIPEGDWQ